jgi:hypothetical protein
MSESRFVSYLEISIGETCLLPMWHPAYRWHDLKLGYYMEHGRLYTDVKGEIQAVIL